MYARVINNPRVYVYDDYFSALNSVLYIKDLKDSSALIKFYKYQVQKIDSPANFDLLFMPIETSTPSYVLKNLGAASDLIEVISFDTVCWGYIKGYIYKPTGHINPPSDSLVKKLDIFMFTQKEQSKNVHRNIPSPYGWYCPNCN